LNPKNYKNFYKDIAEEVEVHKDLVADFVFFFYARLRKGLSELEHHKINVPNLGTFSIRHHKLKKAIKRQKDILGNLQKMTFDGFDKSIPVNEKIKKMEKALEMIEISIKNKKEFKNETK
jgi:nucleoid DNA-binding protein